MSFQVLAADWHRNGSDGIPFYTAIVHDDRHDRNFLVIDFSGEEDGETRTAVLDIDEAVTGNIYMHPQPGRPDTGGNAWRGDALGSQYRDAIQAAAFE